MDAASALADLLELSAHVDAAVIVDEEGTLLAAAPDGVAAERLAEAGVELVREAAERLGGEQRAPTRVEASLRAGTVFAVRDGDRIAVARTRPHPPSALVLHDLESCLRSA